MPSSSVVSFEATFAFPGEPGLSSLMQRHHSAQPGVVQASDMP